MFRPTLFPLNQAAVPAMLLAAGRGERMRPLTDTVPKPLLEVQGKPLMRWQLEALMRGGFTRAVVNTAWLGEQIADKFQSSWVHQTSQIKIEYSHEGRDFGIALETAGGICRALPLLCPQPGVHSGDVFWVLAGDVFMPDFEFTQAALARFVASTNVAHLWLVPNPQHNLRGDFGLDTASGLALNLPYDDLRARFTYSTVGLYRCALFQTPWCDIAPGNPQGIKAALAPLLRSAMDQGRVSAELYAGAWTDVGTPQRLAQLNAT